MFEDPPDGRCADCVAETDEFAVDAAVSPGRVLGRHVDDEEPDCGVGGRSTGCLAWLGPASCDASAVPTQEGVGCNEPSLAAWSGECLSDGAQQRPVVIVQRWPRCLAAEYGELVAQDDDLYVSGAAGPNDETGQTR